MTENLRESSQFRRGVADAIEGHKSEIAGDVWPTSTGALGKLDRTVAGQGDLNPPWQLFDQVLRTNPGPLLDAIAELCGVRWQIVAPPVEESLAELLTELRETQVRLEGIGRAVEGIAARGVRKVVPRVREQVA